MGAKIHNLSEIAKKEPEIMWKATIFEGYMWF
jgi:hypothetical protein